MITKKIALVDFFMMIDQAVLTNSDTLSFLLIVVVTTICVIFYLRASDPIGKIVNVFRQIITTFFQDELRPKTLSAVVNIFLSLLAFIVFVILSLPNIIYYFCTPESSTVNMGYIFFAAVLFFAVLVISLVFIAKTKDFIALGIKPPR